MYKEGNQDSSPEDHGLTPNKPMVLVEFLRQSGGNPDIVAANAKALDSQIERWGLSALTVKSGISCGVLELYVPQDAVDAHALAEN